ncbi:MAG: transketolase C-terminal domain-containing protein [Candidatus Bilamarchaeaceae archaeon]
MIIDDITKPKDFKPTREGVGVALAEIGEKNKDLWVLCADVTESTRMHHFAEKFPKRFVQVGVAEQNLAGAAAGIAATGKTAVISAYGVFSPGRNWDQIRVSICYNDVDVKIHASHTGLNVGPDGASHQALEDIAMVRVLPNIVVLSPADYLQAKKATYAAIEKKGPVYIRTAREKSAIFTTEDTPFEIGKANVYMEGDDVAILAHGMVVYEALLAAQKLKAEGISAAVIDVCSIKPLDKDTIIKYAKKTGFVFTVEEHQVYGGMGSAVAELLSQCCPTKMKIHGIYDRFCESGNLKELFRKYELDADGIFKNIKISLKER